MFVDQLCRSSDTEQDHFIFDLFNLGQKRGIGARAKKEITKEEIITMLYNLPNQGLIVSSPVNKDQNGYSNSEAPDNITS